MISCAPPILSQQKIGAELLQGGDGRVPLSRTGGERRRANYRRRPRTDRRVGTDRHNHRFAADAAEIEAQREAGESVLERAH